MKMRHEELIDKFKESAEQWLKDTPEAKGLILLADWRIGNDVLPPCVCITEELNEQSTISMLRQAIKLVEHLTAVFNKNLNNAESVLKQLLHQHSKPNLDES